HERGTRHHRGCHRAVPDSAGISDAHSPRSRGDPQRLRAFRACGPGARSRLDYAAVPGCPIVALSPRFSVPFRVYWEDTDAGGVVYYANYLKFMERCRTDWLRALGIDQLRLRTERQLQFAVVSVAVDFLRPAVLNDEILVTAELERLSGATIGFRQTIMRGDAQLI